MGCSETHQAGVLARLSQLVTEYQCSKKAADTFGMIEYSRQGLTFPRDLSKHTYLKVQTLPTTNKEELLEEGPMGKSSQNTTAGCTQHTQEILSKIVLLLFAFFFLLSFLDTVTRWGKFTPKE